MSGFDSCRFIFGALRFRVLGLGCSADSGSRAFNCLNSLLKHPGRQMFNLSNLD